MNHVVRMIYNNVTKEVNVIYLERVMDVSRIENIPIEQWLYPFFANGIKWKGIYDELVDFVEVPEFTLRFEGDDDAIQLIRNAMKQKPVKVVGNNNIVTITYTENPFVTRITINGTVFNTMLIQNRCIDEWVQPIHIRNLHWDGIYNELEKFIGSDTYTIYFTGEPEFMNSLYENCPSTVSVFYREAQTSGFLNSASRGMNSNVIGTTTQKVLDNIKDTAINANSVADNDKLPIKNSFIKQHLVTILMGIAVILLFLPFASFSAEVEVAGMTTEGTEMVISGFETMFGANEMPNSSVFAFLLLVVPALIICSNYVKQFQKVRHWLVKGLPLLGIIAQMITLLDIKGIFENISNPAVDMGMVDIRTKTTLGIGFILIFIVYLLTAVVGFIIYGKVGVKKNKK